MSGDAKPASGAFEGAAARPLGNSSEVEEELRFHLDQLTERLFAEGYERSDAKAEARRRFGDLDMLTEQCVAEGAGPLGVALRWLITSTACAWIVSVACVLAVVLTGRPTLTMGYVLLPVAVAAGACAVLAAALPTGSDLVLRAGRRLLALLCLLSLTTFFLSGGDWVHSLWSVQFPLYGLLFGSGLLLVRVWPEDRRRPPELPRGWNGAVTMLLALLVLGSLPFVLSLPGSGAPRVGGSPVPALLEAVGYGFGGAVPESMRPVGGWEAARGLGIPPRIVTVTMGSTLLAATAWVLFAALALAGRAIRAGGRRRSFYLVTPVVLASVLLVVNGGLFEGIWDNEPELAGAYGPSLLVSAVVTVALFLAVRLDERGARHCG